MVVKHCYLAVGRARIDQLFAKRNVAVALCFKLALVGCPNSLSKWFVGFKPLYTGGKMVFSIFAGIFSNKLGALIKWWGALSGPQFKLGVHSELKCTK
ncbi:hypothetical protein Scep_013137 [Stephania cephalantha]|uniref:Uncharacterized protein n=1 Tax=Stephania cephalantha TaxID=152367 RepID=A0AAP0JGS3_9MAGN